MDQPGEVDHVLVEVVTDAADHKALWHLLVRGEEVRDTRRLSKASPVLLAAVGLTVGLQSTVWGTVIFVALSSVCWVLARRSSSEQRAIKVRSALTTMSADGDGLTVTAPGSTCRIAWNVLRVVPTPSRVFVVVTPLSGYVIPRRCFTAPSDVDRFLAFASRQHPGN